MADLFAGFEAFAGLGKPGQITVSYGLSVEYVQTVAQATVQCPRTPRDLVGKFATSFNMPPTQVLDVYVDGRKVGLDDPIPADAREVEFRQPGSEKGSTPVVLPLDDAQTFTVITAYQDTTRYIQTVLDGAMAVDIVPFVTFSGGRSVIKIESTQAFVGHSEVKAIRTNIRFESRVKRHAGGLVPGDGSVRASTISDLIKGEQPIAIRLNGVVLQDGTCQALQPGDRLEVVLPGRVIEQSFRDWQALMCLDGHDAYVKACQAREHNIEARAAQLVKMHWAEIRILGARTGVKLAGLGRTSDKVRADILAAEFPEMPSEETFVTSWLREHAPEALEAPDKESEDLEEDEEYGAQPVYTFEFVVTGCDGSILWRAKVLGQDLNDAKDALEDWTMPYEEGEQPDDAWSDEDDQDAIWEAIRAVDLGHPQVVQEIGTLTVRIVK